LPIVLALGVDAWWSPHWRKLQRGKESRRAAGFAGEHTRVSAVFAVEDWWPGGPYPPRITRFDNPFATAAFPPDALPLDGHWGEVERGPTHVRAHWLAPPRPRALAGD